MDYWTLAYRQWVISYPLVHYMYRHGDLNCLGPSRESILYCGMVRLHHLMGLSAAVEARYLVSNNIFCVK